MEDSPSPFSLDWLLAAALILAVLSGFAYFGVFSGFLNHAPTPTPSPLPALSAPTTPANQTANASNPSPSLAPVSNVSTASTTLFQATPSALPATATATPSPVPQAPATLFSRDSFSLKQAPPSGRPVALKFGDFAKDGTLGFMLVEGMTRASAYWSNGTFLWAWNNPPATGSSNAFDAPGIAWDTTGSGKAEAIFYKVTGNAPFVSWTDPTSGAELHRAPWPANGTDGAALLVANLEGGSSFLDTVVLGSDLSSALTRIQAFDSNGNLLWTRSSNRFSHALLRVKVPGAAADSVFAGDALVSSTGGVLWQVPSSVGGIQAAVLADLNGDGFPEIVVADSTNVTALNLSTGAVLWTQSANATSLYRVPWRKYLPADKILAVSRTGMILLDNVGSPRLQAGTQGGNGAPAFICNWTGTLPYAYFTGRFLDENFSAGPPIPTTGIGCFDSVGDGREELFGVRADAVTGIVFLDRLTNDESVFPPVASSRSDFLYLLGKANEPSRTTP